MPKYIGVFSRGRENNLVPYYTDEELFAVIRAGEKSQSTIAIFELTGATSIFGTHGGVKYIDPKITRMMEGRD